MTPRVEEFLERFAAGDRRGAVARALELLDEGLGAGDVIALVAEAQREVGRRWQADRWTVVQEHTATAVAEDVVASIAARIRRPERSGRVAVVCADGEWHVLPARLFAEGLEDAGIDALFVGGSVPPEHLVAYLPELDVQAVAVSVTIAEHLPGAARSIAAAHTVGLPVIAGGAAFDRHPGRAARVGADAIATDVAAAVAVLRPWLAGHAPSSLSRAELQRDAADALRRAEPGLAAAATHHVATRLQVNEDAVADDVAAHLRFLRAAVALADRSIYADFVPWTLDVNRHRRIPDLRTATIIDVLVDVLGADGHDEAVGVVAETRELIDEVPAPVR